MNIGHALRQLATHRHSEGPSFLAGLVLTVLALFVPEEILTPERQQAVLILAAPCFTYAFQRFYSKAMNGPGGASVEAGP